MQQRLTEEESKQLAKHIVQQMVVMMSNEETVEQVATIWGRYLDQWIGKNLRRLIVLAFIGLMSAVAVKAQVWLWLASLMNK